MKKYLLPLAIIICLSFFNYCVFAQTSKSKKTVPTVVVTKPATKVTPAMEKPNPFGKGTWNFANKTNITYEKDKTQPVGTSRNFVLAVDPKYFFTDHIALGIEGRYLSTKYVTPSLSTYYYYSAYLTLTYGTTISNKVNLYATIGAGPGHSRSYSDGSGVKILEAKYFGYNGTLGVPILLQSEGSTYFTPFVQYNKTKTEGGGHDIDDKGINIGLKLETYFNSTQGKKDKIDFSKGKYNQGSSFLDYNTMSNYSSTTRNEKQGTIAFAPVKRKNLTFGAGYYYYFIDNVAGGLNISYTNFKTFNPGSATTVDKTFIVQPSVIANAPSATALHNLFLQAGYGFGTHNFGGIKKKVTDIDIRTGYNIFFAKNVCLTPKIGYESEKEVTKNGSSIGYTAKSSGLAIELGIRAWLNKIW